MWQWCPVIYVFRGFVDKRQARGCTLSPDFINPEGLLFACFLRSARYHGYGTKISNKLKSFSGLENYTRLYSEKRRSEIHTVIWLFRNLQKRAYSQHLIFKLKRGFKLCIDVKAEHSNMLQQSVLPFKREDWNRVQ